MKTKTRRLLSLLNFCVLTLLACGNSDGAGEDPGVPYLAKKENLLTVFVLVGIMEQSGNWQLGEDIHVPSVYRIIQWWLYMRTMIQAMKCAVVQMKVVHGGILLFFSPSIV